ncbi:MAG: multicopper oxidase family protein [Acidobacteriota bacterium]
MTTLAWVLTALIPWQFTSSGGFDAARAYGFAQSPILTKFIDPLPEIPIATPDPTQPYGPNCDYYTIGIQQFTQVMHSEMPLGTKLRGFVDLTTNPANTPKFGGPLIVAQKGKVVRVKYINTLPAGNFFLPLDSTLMGGMLPQNAVSVHLHGGFSPWISDGTPHQWFTPDGQHGSSFARVPDMPPPGVGEATYYYTNDQSARMLWYHDHFVAMTRVNPYAGLAAPYLITDPEEQYLITNNVLPGYGIPLIIQDKSFVAADIATQDPSWTANPDWGQTVGSLWYPHIYEVNQDAATGAPVPSGRVDYGKWVYPPVVNVIEPMPNPSCVPEFFGDTPVINGAAYPYRDVKPQVYRFRILNGSNARNYNLQLYYEDPSNNGEPVLPVTPTTPLAVAPPTILQIANESGFLPAYTELNTNPPKQWDGLQWNLWLAPAERADILIDFSGIPDGTRLILYSDMAAPSPMGDPRNDYFTGDPDFSPTGLNMGGAPTTLVGKGPNTRTLMEFRVNSAAADPAFTTTMAAIKAYLADPVTGLPGVFARSQPAPIVPVGTPVNNRSVTVGGFANMIKTLNEEFDDYGRLLQRLGTNQLHLNNQGVFMPGFGYDQQITEKAFAGTSQVWTVVNNTGDVHPIHFHLVSVQVVARTDWAGNSIPIDPNEMGWKETVRMLPGQNTTVAMKFDLPKVPFLVKPSIRPRNGALPFNRFTNPLVDFGHEYVWHCHILEHEEHDMMRPLSVYRPVFFWWLHLLDGK